jgi:hypothetical protein
MKSDARKRSVSVALVVTVVLALVAPVAAGAQDVTPIPPGPATTLPDYIGASAKAHPTANSAPQKNPFMAPHPFPWSHSDSWNSDTANIAGPLGRNPEVFSSTLAKARQDSDWLFTAESWAFDSRGRPIVNGFGLNEASVIMVDPDTLEVLTSYPLATTEGDPVGEGDQKVPRSAWAIYSYIDNRDQINIVSGSNKILVLREAGSPSSPVFEKVEEYDLSRLVNGTTQRITGLIVDFQGRYWLNMGTSANIFVLNPATARYPYLDLPRVDLGEGEVTRNGLALTKEGAYVVTTKKMYRVDAGADDQPYVVWSVPYDTIGKVRPGQYEFGSGTSPTILGEGKYVAITDNADQMNVVVYRTEAGLPPDQRIVCKVPVFDFPEGGKGANSNSLIGSHNSLIVQNAYGYLFDWDRLTLAYPGAPGIERIDIDPNGKGCTKVWVNTEVTSTLCPKLSTRTGLIYTQDRKYDAAKDLYAVYWVALDFRTGEVVWEKLAGTFGSLAPPTFDNFWSGIGIGPNGAMYGGQYGGITMIRDRR